MKINVKDLEQFVGKRVWVRCTRYVAEDDSGVFFIAVVRGLREYDDGNEIPLDDIGVVFEKEEVRVSHGKLVAEELLRGTEGEYLFASSIKGIGLCSQEQQEQILLGELL